MLGECARELSLRRRGPHIETKRLLSLFRCSAEYIPQNLNIRSSPLDLSGDRCPLPLLGPARGQPGPAPRAVTSHPPNPKSGPGGSRSQGAGAGPRLREPGREAPGPTGSWSRTWPRRAACPPCRAGPTSAGGKPPRARRPHAGRYRLRCHAASRRRATSRAASAPPAARPGPLAAPRRW
jgi:hypothetical protein